jgi:uncharacterized RDD family membrane protein YckC
VNTPEAAAYPGERLALPQTGVGSVASMGVRILAFLIDLAVSFGVAWLFTQPELPRNWSLLVWAAMTVMAVGSFGFTPGQAAVGIRVAPIDGRTFVGLWAVPRTVLTFVIVPPLLQDADGRGLHDRICRTVVIRSR